MADLFSNTNNFPGNKFGSPLNPPSASGPKQNKNQIITSLYRSILGRDPDSSALMYYISQPEINEDTVRKQMIESEEHKTILEEYKNIPKIKKEMDDIQVTMKAKEKLLKDKEMEIEELNKILAHKSNEITRVKKEMDELTRALTVDKKRSEYINREIVKVDVGLRKIVKELLKKFKKVD